MVDADVLMDALEDLLRILAFAAVVAVSIALNGCEKDVNDPESGCRMKKPCLFQC